MVPKILYRFFMSLWTWEIKRYCYCCQSNKVEHLMDCSSNEKGLWSYIVNCLKQLPYQPQCSVKYWHKNRAVIMIVWLWRREIPFLISSYGVVSVRNALLRVYSSPDLILRVYYFQSNSRWGWFWVWDQDYWRFAVICGTQLQTDITDINSTPK